MAASLTAPKQLPGYRMMGGPRPKPYSGNVPGNLKICRVLVGPLQPAEVVIDAVATYQVLQVPAGTFIQSVVARIITAFTAAVTIGIGDGDATSGWLSTAKLAPTVADTIGLYKGGLFGTQDAAAMGKKYLVADTIDVIVGGAAPLVGLLELLVTYSDQLTFAI